MIYTISEGSIQSQWIPQDIIVSGPYIVKLSRRGSEQAWGNDIFPVPVPVGKRIFRPGQ